MIVRTFCLSIHAQYGCRHSGACCSQWKVSASDPVVVEVVRRHGLRTHPAGDRCVFRQRERCAIHRAAGEEALPIGCRHYPRVLLRDQRGMLVSLSHYCPTAASLLFGAEPPRVVAAPAVLTVREPVEGLDARGELPPLLRPGMLADCDGYAAWETAVIDTFARTGCVERALTILETATEIVRGWKPGDAALADTVAIAFDSADGVSTRERGQAELTFLRGAASAATTFQTVPDLNQRWHAIRSSDDGLDRPIAHYLAARAFGNWIAYQGMGLRTVVGWLRACYDVLRTHAVAPVSAGTLSPAALAEAIRLTDLFMLHTIDSAAFARAAAALEHRAA